MNGNILAQIANPVAQGANPVAQAYTDAYSKTLNNRLAIQNQSLLAQAQGMKQQQQEYAMSQLKRNSNLKEGMVKLAMSMDLPEASEMEVLQDIMDTNGDPRTNAVVKNLMSIANRNERNAAKQRILTNLDNMGVVDSITPMEREKAQADIYSKVQSARYEGYTSEMKNAIGITGIDDIKNPENREWVRKLATQKRAENVVNNIMGGNIDEFTKYLARNVSEAESAMFKKGYEESNRARSMDMELDQIGKALDEMEKAGIETGPTTEILTQAKALGKKLFGIEFEGLSATETFRALTNRQAMSVRNPDSGLGLTGATSDRDLDFLKASVNSLSTTIEGNRLLIKMMRSVNHFKQMRHAKLAQITNDVLSGKLKGAMPSVELQKWLDTAPILSESERKEAERLMKGGGTPIKESPSKESPKPGRITKSYSSLTGDPDA